MVKSSVLICPKCGSLGQFDQTGMVRCVRVGCKYRARAVQFRKGGPADSKPVDKLDISRNDYLVGGGVRKAPVNYD